MNKKLLISLLSALVLSATTVVADDTTTNTRPEPPKFENGTPPDFVKGQSPQGQPPQMNGKKDQKGQFGGTASDYNNLHKILSFSIII